MNRLITPQTIPAMAAVRIVLRAQTTRRAWFSAESNTESCCIDHKISARCVPLVRSRDLRRSARYQPRTLAKISGATMVASDSMMYLGVLARSFPQVIFSLGTAPEYDPKLVVESLIWQK